MIHFSRLIRAAAFAALVMAVAPSAMAGINGGMSGSFYNPANDGTGLNIEILSSDFGIAYWYTYGLDGEQRWHLLLGDIDGQRMSGQMFTFKGMVFGEFDPTALDQHTFGTFQIEFQDCNTLSFNYSPAAVQPDGRYYPSGRLDMQRLTSPIGVAEQCVTGDPAPDRSAVAGIYFGTISPIGFPAIEAIVLIAEDGSLMGLSDNGMYFGILSVDENRFAGRIIAVTFDDFVFQDGDFMAYADISGTRQGSQLQFDYEVRSRNSGQLLEQGSYNASYDPLYDQPLTQPDLTGTWFTDLGYRFDIDQEGRVSGRGSGACRYYGTIRPIDPRFNAATARLLPANCWDVDGTVELTVLREHGILYAISSGDEFYFDIWRR